MKVSAGTRNTSSSNDRQVTINVTGLARNDFVRSADCVMQVPYTRMNETLRMVHRMGGKVIGVSVTGVTESGEVAPAPPRKGKPKK